MPDSPARKWFEFRAAAGSDCTKVMLYDEIGSWGVTAKDFCNALDAVKTKNIDLHINSYGGEVIDGLAIYNAVKGHAAVVTAHIDGLAASIASVIALAADKVCIAKNALMMIHNGWGLAIGDSSEMRKQADVLDKICAGITRAYMDKTGKKEDEVKAAMDAETWFDADEAKAWGLVDEIADQDGDEDQMAASALLAVAKYRKTPPALQRFAARLKTQPQDKGPKMDKITKRDGKYFLGDVEVDASALTPASVPAATPAPVAAVQAPTTDAMAKAREDGVKAERDYRALFNTIMESASLTGDAAKNFEKEFYGRAESDLKFLASHAISKRATPVGESAPGNGEGEGAGKSDDKAVADAQKRWASDSRLRRMHGCNTDNPEDAQYKARGARYMRVVAKNLADSKPGAGKFDEVNDGDAVSAALANKAMLSFTK